LTAVDVLKRYLEEHKVTQVEFAERIGVHQPTVSDWLSGRFKPSLANLQAISAETGLSIDELLGNPRRGARGQSQRTSI